jgi:serine protease Do
MRRLILPMFLLAAAAPTAEARQTVTVAPRARAYASIRSDEGDRAMLGISTSSSGKRDTLGLLIESVSPGSPADKAGLEEGNRIASINGVSLKLSREDAGEPDMSGTMTNRLVREMRKLKVGDEATLEIWNSGRNKTVKVKTVAADDLTPDRMSRQDAEDRPALGISLGSSGSRRDTLGVFVSGVDENGPADKAGIVEGDRIASVNGVDLRVPKEDIGDWSVAGARVARLQREVRKLKAGQTVDLSVVEGGRARTVKVTLARAGDLERTNGFSFSTGDGGSFITMPRVPMAPMSPRAPMSPMPPMPPMSSMPRDRVRVFGGDGSVQLDLDGLRESLLDIGPRVRAELDRELPRMRDELDREMPRVREELNRELPQAMDNMRRQMDRMKIAMPLMRLRVGRGVII